MQEADWPQPVPVVRPRQPAQFSAVLSVEAEEEQTRLRNALNVRAVLDRIPVAHNQIASAGGLALHLTAPKKRKQENLWKKNPGALAEMIGGSRVPLGHTIHIHFDEEDPTPEEQEQQQQQQQQQIEKEKQEERNTRDTQYKKEKEDLFAPPRKVPEWKKQEDEEKKKKRVTRRGRGKRERKPDIEEPAKRIRVRKESLVEYLTEPAVPHDPTPTPPPTPAPPFTTENQYQALQAQNEAIHQENNTDETNTDSISEEEEKKSVVLSRRQRKRQQQEQRKESLQKRARLENGLTLFAIFLFGLLLGLFRSSST